MKQLDSMKRKEIEEYLRENNMFIKQAYKLNKPQLIEAIRRGIKNEELFDPDKRYAFSKEKCLKHMKETFTEKGYNSVINDEEQMAWFDSIDGKEVKMNRSFSNTAYVEDRDYERFKRCECVELVEEEEIEEASPVIEVEENEMEWIEWRVRELVNKQNFFGAFKETDKKELEELKLYFSKDDFDNLYKRLLIEETYQVSLNFIEGEKKLEEDINCWKVVSEFVCHRGGTVINSNQLKISVIGNYQLERLELMLDTAIKCIESGTITTAYGPKGNLKEPTKNVFIKEKEAVVDNYIKKEVLREIINKEGRYNEYSDRYSNIKELFNDEDDFFNFYDEIAHQESYELKIIFSTIDENDLQSIEEEDLKEDESIWSDICSYLYELDADDVTDYKLAISCIGDKELKELEQYLEEEKKKFYLDESEIRIKYGIEGNYYFPVKNVNIV